MTTDNRALWELVDEGLQYFDKAGDAGDKEYVKAIRQYIAILERPVVVGGWLSIDSAPNDGTPHVRGLHVYAPDGQFLYWDIEAGHIDPDDGQFYDQSGDVSGWSSDDFTHWMPLPAAPETNESMVRGKS